MKAAQISEYGGQDVLKITNDAPKPTAGAGEVVVEVHAAAVNPFDFKVRAGYMKDMFALEFPAILGGDLSGVVVEIGQGVDSLAVGDAVFGQANAVSGHGSYAEFAPVNAGSLAIKPSSLDFASSAAVPLAGVSAYQALVDHAGLADGQKILVHGAAGGIGSFAVQLAKHLGAYVAATATADDKQYVVGLGANEVIDYTEQDFSTILSDFDVVYDTVGGETFVKSHLVLKPGGVIVTMAAQADEALAKQYNVRQIAQFTQVTTQRLAKLRELIDLGVIKVNIDKSFPLDEAAEALSYIQSGKHRGKTILTIKP